MSDEEQNFIKGVFGLIILVIIFFVSIFSSNNNLDWECPSCTFKNKYTLTQCYACKTLRPEKHWYYIGYKRNDNSIINIDDKINTNNKDIMYIYTLKNNGTEFINAPQNSRFKNQCMLISILQYLNIIFFDPEITLDEFRKQNNINVQYWKCTEEFNFTHYNKVEIIGKIQQKYKINIIIMKEFIFKKAKKDTTTSDKQQDPTTSDKQQDPTFQKYGLNNYFELPNLKQYKILDTKNFKTIYILQKPNHYELIDHNYNIPESIITKYYKIFETQPENTNCNFHKEQNLTEEKTCRICDIEKLKIYYASIKYTTSYIDESIIKKIFHKLLSEDVKNIVIDNYDFQQSLNLSAENQSSSNLEQKLPSNVEQTYTKNFKNLIAIYKNESLINMIVKDLYNSTKTEHWMWWIFPLPFIGNRDSKSTRITYNDNDLNELLNTKYDSPKLDHKSPKLEHKTQIIDNWILVLNIIAKKVQQDKTWTTYFRNPDDRDRMAKSIILFLSSKCVYQNKFKVFKQALINIALYYEEQKINGGKIYSNKKIYKTLKKYYN
jgi:hypothetical protein